MALVVSGCGVEGVRGQAARVASFLMSTRRSVSLMWGGRWYRRGRCWLIARWCWPLIAGWRWPGWAALARGESAPGVVSGSVLRDGGRVGVMFSGQGSQYAGMGQELYQALSGVRRGV